MTESMTAPVHQRIADPVFRWPASGWWLTGISAVIGCVLLIWPKSIELPFLERLLICVAVTLLPFTALLLLHVWQCDRVFVRRARAYSDLVTSLEDAASELVRANDEAESELDRARALISNLLREREEKNSLRIAYCYVFDGKPLIALKGKRGFSVSVGDLFTVVDLEAVSVLGKFEVIENSGEHYVARCSGDMDALWFGNMKQAGATRSEPPPRTLAIRLSVEESTNDREYTEITP